MHFPTLNSLANSLAIPAVATASLLSLGCISEEDYSRVFQEKEVLGFAVEDLEKELKDAQFQIQAERDLHARSIAEMEKRIDEAAAAAEETRQQLEASLQALREEFEAYKDEYRIQVRADAAGRDLGDFKTLGGRTYFATTISEVNPGGIKLGHSAGAAYVPFDEIPPELAREFAFDPDEALEFLKGVEEAERAFKTQVAGGNGLRPSGDQMAEMEREASAIRRRIGVWEGQVTQITNDIAILRRDGADPADIRDRERRINEFKADIQEAKAALAGLR
ncbi:hypothetical protein BH23VER1_BH23VER1_11710 [soil metagenome]